MLATMHKAAARSMATDPHSLTRHLADVLAIRDPDAVECVRDLCDAIMVYKLYTTGAIARRYLSESPGAMRRRFRRAGLPTPTDCVVLIRVALVWLHIQAFDIPAKTASTAAGIVYGDMHRQLWRRTGLRPRDAHNYPVELLIARWNGRVIQPLQVSAVPGQLHLFAAAD